MLLLIFIIYILIVIAFLANIGDTESSSINAKNEHKKRTKNFDKVAKEGELKMKHFDKYISFKSVEDVQEFVQAISNINYDMDLLQDRYIVNAKSILGILSLHINKPINIKAFRLENSTEDDYKKLDSLIKKYEQS